MTVNRTVNSAQLPTFRHIFEILLKGCLFNNFKIRKVKPETVS